MCCYLSGSLSLSLWAPFPIFKDPVMPWAHLDNPGDLLCFQVSRLAALISCVMEGTYSLLLGVRTWTSLEQLILHHDSQYPCLERLCNFFFSHQEMELGNLINTCSDVIYGLFLHTLNYFSMCWVGCNIRWKRHGLCHHTHLRSGFNSGIC